MQSIAIKQENLDEHIFIVLECKDRPTISLDVFNSHGRRGLLLRVDGMSIGTFLLDVKELKSKYGEKLFRYCQFCGEKINLYSSISHKCKEDVF